ncbi:MAG: hypothetical protein AAB480_00650 [Patescibacteria group bacterium]
MFNFFKKEIRREKPDGSFQYRDENGTLHEGWLPPEKFQEMVAAGKAKRVYKVLIKGPWEGVKEDWWEIEEETLKKFGDENDTVHAMCVYEKGEPKYNFVAKKMWEKWGEVSRIVSNSNLSSEQQAAEVKRLLAE